MKQTKAGALKNFSYLIISLVLLIILISFSFYRSNTASQSLTHTWNVKSNARKLLATVIDAETGQRGYLITLDARYLSPYETAKLEYSAVFAETIELISDNESQLQRLASLDSAVTLKFNELKSSIQIAEEGRQAEALDMVKSDVGKTYMEHVRKLIDDIVAEEDSLLKEHVEVYDRWKYIILIIIAIAILLILYSAFTLFKKINPLFENLISTQDKLEKANSNLSETLEESKSLNKFKEQALIENNNLIHSLQAKNEQLDHFAYIASHDLQEPLRTVSNYLEIFQEDYEEKLDEETEKYFRFINDAVDRMRKLIAGLLTFSRLGTSGKIVKADLNDALQEVKESYRVKIEELKATITSSDLPELNGYKLELTQLLQNLISNAMKFIRKDIRPEIHINCESKDGYYLIKVSDNGIGIKEKDLEKIFEMFSRLHSTRDYDGQGIGLAFCKKIVELHQGRIWVTSEIGKGTTFHFTLKKEL